MGVLVGDELVERPGQPGVELRGAPHLQLNRMLTEGEIDFGPISSIA